LVLASSIACSFFITRALLRWYVAVELCLITCDLWMQASETWRFWTRSGTVGALRWHHHRTNCPDAELQLLGMCDVCVSLCVCARACFFFLSLFLFSYIILIVTCCMQQPWTRAY
jgi:hypothetical protein